MTRYLKKNFDLSHSIDVSELNPHYREPNWIVERLEKQSKDIYAQSVSCMISLCLGVKSSENLGKLPRLIHVSKNLATLYPILTSYLWADSDIDQLVMSTRGLESPVLMVNNKVVSLRLITLHEFMSLVINEKSQDEGAYEILSQIEVKEIFPQQIYKNYEKVMSNLTNLEPLSIQFRGKNSEGPSLKFFVNPLSYEFIKTLRFI